MGTVWEEPGRGGGACRPSNISVRAYCLPTSYRDLTVKMGATYLYSRCKTTVDVPVKHISSHKDFDWNLTPNDIALLQLAHSVNYSACIQPVSLPKNFEVRPGTQCWITGWGRTLEFGETGWQDLRGDVWCPGVGLQAERKDREAGSLQVGKGGGGAEAARE